MLDDAPRTTPAEMPTAAAVAPDVSARFPEAAVVFDHLHALRDVTEMTDRSRAGGSARDAFGARSP